MRRFEAIANDVADLVLEFGGALSGEHGDGLVRSPFMEKMFGPALYEAFRTIKRTFDPHGIFNPGKIVDAPPLTANLRFGPAYAAAPLPTYFDYSDTAAWPAPSRCAAALGACRKTLDGTMCPSYMATRDEQHSTRGRANVLRLAMAGPARRGRARRRGRLRDARPVPRVPRVQGRVPGRRRRRPLQERVPRRLLAAPRHAAAGAGARQRASRSPNGAAGSRRCRTGSPNSGPVDASTSGCSASIAGDALPQFQPTHPREGGSAAAIARRPPDVLLFNDTFTNYYDPEIGLAALDVLAAAGVARGARTESLLRPSADLERAARDARGAGGAERRRAVRRRRRPAGSSSSASRAACRPCARTRRRCCAARRGGKAEVVAAASVLFEEFVEPRAGELALEARPDDDPAARPLPSEVDGPASRRRRRCSPRIPGSDGRRSRCRLLRHGRLVRLRARALRRLARDRRTQAVPGRSRQKPEARSSSRPARRCRHQVADFTGETRRASRGAARRSRASSDATCTVHLTVTSMSLAWLSLAALVVAMIVSCFTQLNVGVLALAFAWIVGVYLGGMRLDDVLSGFPAQLVPDAGRRHAALHAGAAQRHARPRGARVGAALPRQRRPDPGHVLRAGRRSSPRSGRATSPPRRCWRRWRWPSAARAAIPPFLMAIMVGNGAQSGALSPFAPTGIIVNGLMEKIGLAGYEWQTYCDQPRRARPRRVRRLLRCSAAGAVPAAATRATDRAERATHRFSTGALVTHGRHRVRAASPCCSSSANIGMAAFTGAVVLAALARRRSRAGDPQDAVDADPDGQRRQRAGRAAREDGGLDLFTAICWPAGHAGHADRRHRVRHRAHLGLQQHLGRRAAGVPADRARAGRAPGRRSRSASPRR